MIVKIECPSCDTEGSMSLADIRYNGPYKCWKCKALFTIEVERDTLKSCTPLSEEEFQGLLAQQTREKAEQKRLQELEDFKNKFRR